MSDEIEYDDNINKVVTLVRDNTKVEHRPRALHAVVEMETPNGARQVVVRDACVIESGHDCYDLVRIFRGVPGTDATELAFAAPADRVVCLRFGTEDELADILDCDGCKAGGTDNEE